jgi:hypothetical protein
VYALQLTLSLPQNQNHNNNQNHHPRLFFFSSYLSSEPLSAVCLSSAPPLYSATTELLLWTRERMCGIWQYDVAKEPERKKASSTNKKIWF